MNEKNLTNALTTHLVSLGPFLSSLPSISPFVTYSVDTICNKTLISIKKYERKKNKLTNGPNDASRIV